MSKLGDLGALIGRYWHIIPPLLALVRKVEEAKSAASEGGTEVTENEWAGIGQAVGDLVDELDG